MTSRISGSPRSSAGARSDASPHLKQTAISKVVGVIEALGDCRRVSDLAQVTGLPLSTVHRILRELVTLGWVREAGDHDYMLGARFLTLAGRAGDQGTLTRLAHPILRGLRDATGHAVHFAVRQGDEVVYIDKLEGRRAYHMRSRVGLGVPLHSTSIGKAVLAQLPKVEVIGVAERTGLPSRTPNTISTAAALVEHLARVRRRGFAVDDEENEADIRCVGAVVTDHRQLPIGGISVSCLAFELDDARLQEYAPLVVEAADALSRALGAHTPRPTDEPA